MATTTPRLNLPRPEPEDLVTRANHNALVDAIDANAETPAGAQAKADEAEQKAKQYTDGKIAVIDVPVTSVNGKTGEVELDKSDVGLSKVKDAEQATKTEFDAHVQDNVRHITASERSNWNAKETTAGAQAKANAARDAAIDWAKSFGLGTYDIRLSNDLNDETEIGWTRIDDEDTANRPAGFGWGFCFTGVRSGGARYQIAYRTDGSGIDIRSRKYVSGAWDSDWAIDWNSDSLHDPARLNQVNTFKRPQIIELDNTGHAVAQRLRSTGVGSDFGWSLRADGTLGLHDYVSGETLVTIGPNGVNARQGLSVDGEDVFTNSGGNINGRVTILDLLSLSVSGRTAYLQGGEDQNDTGAEVRVSRRNTPTGKVSRFGIYAEEAQVNNHDIWTGENNPVQFAENGYQRLANGLIIQWGRIPNVSPGSSGKSGTFPIAFPNVTYQAYATVEADEPSYANVGFLTKTGLQVWLEADQPRSVRWLAIGR